MFLWAQKLVEVAANKNWAWLERGLWRMWLPKSEAGSSHTKMSRSTDFMGICA
jgi:hypothetical protein